MISKRPVNTSEPETVAKTTATASEPAVETTATASEPVSTSGEMIEIDILIVRTDEDGAPVEEFEDEFKVRILISVYQRKNFQEQLS